MWQCDHLTSVDSTQLEALRRLHPIAAQSGARPFAVWTTQQTQGQGRYGRPWINCGQSLAISFAWPDSGGTADRPDAAWPIRISLAVIEAIAAVSQATGPNNVVGVKWPNDIMLGNAKLGGVLVHRHHLPRGPWLIAGIGLNLKWQSERPTDRQVADLADLGVCSTDPMQLVQALQDALTRELGSQQGSEHSATDAPLQTRFLNRDVYAGLPVSVHDANTGGLLARGINRGINQAGELLVETAQALRAISIGEVSLRPMGPAQPEGHIG